MQARANRVTIFCATAFVLLTRGSSLQAQSDLPELATWLRNTNGRVGYNNIPADVHLVVPTNNQTTSQGAPDITRYHWMKVTEKADFPGSYNFTLFTINNELWAFHPSGTWHSRDGKNWTKSPLPSILNDAFLDYVHFKGAVYALGTFEGNIERFTQTSRISRTTDLTSWEVIARESNLPRRYFYTTLVYNDKVWMIGGEYRGTVFKDVWNSDDCVHWKQVSTANPWHSAGWGRGAVVFNGRMYLSSSEVDKPVQVYSSSDGAEWRMETEQVNPIPFWGAKAIVFDNTIWLLGCNRSGAFSNEVIYSVDGKNWMPERAPWSPRGGVAATVFQDKLFMTGGKYSTGAGDSIRFIYSNDVWCLEKRN